VDKGKEQGEVSKEAPVWHERRLHASVETTHMPAVEYLVRLQLLLFSAVASIDDDSHPKAKQKKQMPPQRQRKGRRTLNNDQNNKSDHTTRTHAHDMTMTSRHRHTSCSSKHKQVGVTANAIKSETNGNKESKLTSPKGKKSR